MMEGEPVVTSSPPPSAAESELASSMTWPLINIRMQFALILGSVWITTVGRKKRMYKIKWTEEKIATLVKEGRGSGEGDKYVPWLNRRSFTSTGRCHSIPSVKNNRSHEVFSDIEERIFHIVDYCMQVDEIYEQRPLPRRDTQRHALERDIPHPCYPRTHVPFVMTVDFEILRTTPQGRRKMWIDGKEDHEAEDPRSLEKLEIVRSYAESLCIPHIVIYDSQINRTMARNIMWIRQGLPNQKESPFDKRNLEHLAIRMTDELASQVRDDRPLQKWCDHFDQSHGLRPGTALRVSQILMWRRIFTADVFQPELARAPMNSFRLYTSASSAYEPMPALVSR
jgi:hypothetical protein